MRAEASGATLLALGFLATGAIPRFALIFGSRRQALEEISEGPKSHKLSKLAWILGRACWARTSDQRIMSPLL